MLRWALRAIVFQAVHRQRDELLLRAGISNMQGEWTAVLGLTEGSLSEIHHLSCWEAKTTYNAKSALGLSPPIFRWVPESAEEVSGDWEVSARRSGRNTRIQGRSREGKRCFHVMKCESIRAKRWARGSAVAWLLNISALQPFRRAELCLGAWTRR